MDVQLIPPRLGESQGLYQAVMIPFGCIEQPLCLKAVAY
jgi:hypothetical protein